MSTGMIDAEGVRRFRRARERDLAAGCPHWAADWFGGMEYVGITRDWTGGDGVATYLDAWNDVEPPCCFAPPDDMVRDSHLVTSAVYAALGAMSGRARDCAAPLPVDRYNAQDYLFQNGAWLPERLRPKRTLEIGPGFGRQVNLWHRRNPDCVFVALEAIENSYMVQRFYYGHVPGARFVDYIDAPDEPMAFDAPGIYHLPTWRMDLLPAGHFDLIIAVQVLPELGEALALHLFDTFATWLKPEGALYIRDHDLACLRGNRLDSEALLPPRGFHRELRPLLVDKVDLHGIPRLWRRLDPGICYRPVDGDPSFGPGRR